MIGFQAGENPFQLLRILEIIANNRCSVCVRLYVLLEVEFVLQDVIDNASQEGDISAHTDRSIDISVFRSTRELWINTYNSCSELFRSHHPAKPYRVTYGKSSP